MALETICGTLCNKHGIGAVWQGQSIYIGDKRVASIATYREAKNIIVIYSYKIYV